jgi:hypothetical protein
VCVSSDEASGETPERECVVLWAWEKVLQFEQAYALPLFIGGECIPTNIRNGLSYARCETEIPDKIVMVEQVGEDLSESFIAFSGTFDLNANDLMGLHGDRLEHGSIGCFDIPYPIFQEMKNAIGLMGAMETAFPWWECHLDSSFAFPGMVWCASAPTSQEQSNFIDEMMM